MVFDIETTGFSPRNNQVITIGAAKQTVHGVKGEVFYISDTVTDPENGERQPARAEELDVLESFVEFAENSGPVFHFNGDVFDFPFLISRAMPNKTENSEGQRNQLVERIRRLWFRKGVDLCKKERKVNGYAGSLEDTARRLGLQVPSNGVKGGDVPELFQRGEVEKIVEYQKIDVKLTLQIAKKL